MDEKTIAARALLYAREAIAAKKDADGAPHSAAAVRAGEWDDQHEVKDAALGARAAIIGLHHLGEARMRSRKCECASPMVRCDHRGCRCQLCGELA